MTDAPEVEQLSLDQIIVESKRLGIWTYMATASAKGRPKWLAADAVHDEDSDR